MFRQGWHEIGAISIHYEWEHVCAEHASNNQRRIHQQYTNLSNGRRLMDMMEVSNGAVTLSSIQLEKRSIYISGNNVLSKQESYEQLGKQAKPQGTMKKVYRTLRIKRMERSFSHDMIRPKVLSLAFRWRIYNATINLEAKRGAILMEPMRVWRDRTEYSISLRLSETCYFTVSSRPKSHVKGTQVALREIHWCCDGWLRTSVRRNDSTTQLNSTHHWSNNLCQLECVWWYTHITLIMHKEKLFFSFVGSPVMFQWQRSFSHLKD